MALQMAWFKNEAKNEIDPEEMKNYEDALHTMRKFNATFKL